jgi:hypothetical protein
MRADSPPSESRIAVVAHPPERRRRPPAVAACCCCCCCCCLHSLGGLIATGAAGRSRTLEERRATVTYWVCLLAALAVTCAWSFLTGGEFTGLLVAALLLPVYQLGTSVVAAVITGITVGPRALPRIWSMTWRGFLGAVIGLGIMLALAFGANGKPGALFLAVLGLIIVCGLMYSIPKLLRRASTS